MKKFFAVLFLSVLFLSVNAQEPGNNLGKSIAQIQSSFPNLSYLREEKGYQIYKFNADDDDFTSFYFSNGRLVGEYTYMFDYSGSRFITDLYYSLLKNFAKYNVKRKRNTSSDYDVTFFYFPNFIVKIANYNTQLQIYYELNGLYIKINALQARPPRY